MNPMTRRHTWTRLACALSLGIAAFAAQADEGALYGPCLLYTSDAADE